MYVLCTYMYGSMDNHLHLPHKKVCTSDQHTRAALHVWEGAPAGSLDGWDPVPLFTAALPEGSQQPQPTRRQITLDAFLHRPTAGGAAGGAGGAGGGNKKTNTSNTSNTTNTTNTNTKNTNKTNNTSKTPAAAVPPLPTTSMPQAGAPPRVSQGPGGWRAGLRNVALAPQQHPDVVLRTTQHSVLMLDGYPKAQRHALVLARDPLLRGPRDLRREHVGVLQDMMVHMWWFFLLVITDMCLLIAAPWGPACHGFSLRIPFSYLCDACACDVMHHTCPPPLSFHA